MINWIISSSVLIIVVICLRTFFKGKIRLRFQYALWLLVAVRLLVPLSFGSSAISVQNVTNRVVSQSIAQRISKTDVVLPDILEAPVTENRIKIYDSVFPESNQLIEDDSDTPKSIPLSVNLLQIAAILWIMGAAGLGITFVVTNVHFHRKIKDGRQRLEASYINLPVYVSDAIDSPCLFWLFRPCIYVTQSVAENSMLLRHCVYHELTHFQQGDLIWGILRCICLSLHWYNPLVWWAARLSKQDAELACDEATIAKLGEDERLEYGKTLIELTCKKRDDLFITATTMSSKKKNVRERITFIAKKPKMAFFAVLIIVVVSAIAIGCTFTKSKEVSLESLPVKMSEDKGSSFVNGREKARYSFPVKVSENRTLTVALKSPEPEKEYFSVDEILVYEGDELLQNIDVSAIVPSEDCLYDGLFVNQGGKFGEPDILDVNFDGSEDYGLLCAETYPKNIPYCYFTWHPESNTFEYSFTLCSFGKLEVDYEKKQILETIYSTNGHTVSVYVFSEDGSLVHQPQFYTEPQKDKVCLAVMPDGISKAGGDYRYLIPEDQTSWMDAYEEMRLHASGSGIWLENEKSYGIWVVYNDEWTYVTDQGFIFDFAKRVNIENAARLYFLCLEEANTNGTGSPLRPENIPQISSATLEYQGTYTVTDRSTLNDLRKILFTSKELHGGSACPFTAALTLEFEEKEAETIYFATDSCAVWLTDGVYYEYFGYTDIEEIYNIFKEKGDGLNYRDEELIEMACNYMAEETVWNSDNYEVESAKDTLTIWFYDVISDEESGHGVTRGRFEINRETGMGEDLVTFEEIDFTKYIQNSEEEFSESQKALNFEFSFDKLENLNFTFLSGAGAWCSMMTIAEDGSFHGVYEDGDMGSQGENYPNGTAYYCEFQGKFSEPIQKDTYIYSAKIEELTYQNPAGTQEIKDGIRYIYSDAYGLNDPEEILFYLPGIPIRDLPEGYLSWVHGNWWMDFEFPKNYTTLPFYGLYNVNLEQGFSSYNVEEYYNMYQ